MAKQSGRLHRLEVENWKSYGGRQVIGPFSDFTAVIGPNGAGKSNLMDAVSFAVGLQSKDLRGRQLKDLIYRADGDSDAEERRASVTLVYERDGRETKFQRCISSQGTGEYRIDSKLVSYDTYASRLQDLGVLASAHTGFLVFQGYVSELANKSPSELTALFEKISGSEELKAEDERLAKEKKAAEDDQQYNFNKKRALGQERNNMKKQKEEAEKYSGLLGKVDELKQRLFLLRLFGIEVEVTSLHAELTGQREELETATARQSAVEEAVKANEKEKSSIARERGEAERKAAQLQKQIGGKEPTLIRLREEITHIEKKKAVEAKALKKAEEKRERAEEASAKLDTELSNIAETIDRLQSKHAGSQEDLAMGKEKRSEYKRLKTLAGANTAAFKERLQAARRELNTEEHLLVQLQNKANEVAKQHAEINGKLLACEEGRQAEAERVRECGEAVERMRAEMRQLIAEDAKTQQSREHLETELAQVQSSLLANKAEKKDSERQKKSQEALENLSRLFSGVHGRIIDICKPALKKYHAATTIAMGKSIDAIVVDEEKVALDCIKYLKEKKCPPETFVPLDTIRTKPVSERLRQLGGTKKLLLDVVTADQRFQPALQYALADTIVCDSLDEARRLAFESHGERFKVVTTDGTLINKAGLMTGGSSPAERARASRWNDKEYSTLKAQADQLERELVLLGSAHRAGEQQHALDLKMQQKQQELAAAQSDQELSRTKLEKHTKELEALAKSREQTDEELKKLQKKRSELSSQVQSFEQQSNAEEDRIFEAFSRSLGVASVREYEEKQLREAKEHEAQVLELQAQQAKVRSRQQFVRREDLPGAIEKLQAQIRADEDELAKKSAQQAEAKAEVQSLQGQAAGLEEAAGSHKVALETKAAELKQLKKTLKLASEETGRAKARAGQIEGDLQQQRSQRQRTYQQARIEEVNLPQVYEAVERDSGSSAAKKRKKRSAAPDPAKPGGESVMLASELFSPNALVGTGTADGDAEDDGAPPGVADGQEQPVRIDFSVLDEGERQGDLRRLEQETEAELQELRRRQESMAPNMKAPQQFDEVSGRLASAENDFKALSSNTKNIRERADSVRKERKQRFLAAFEHIAHVIDGIYKDLTQVEGVPLGGSAFLTTLESDQEGGLPGISFQAMPAGKRIRPMSQLSGGERTLAALALLFAIHDYQPSPFFVMDEIDAALDNVNVTRVGAYIRERAEEGEVQFVVISLKDNFYEKAHGLVGIHRDRRLECSRTLTLDLTRAQGV